MPTTDDVAAGLCGFIDASPSPFHACRSAGDMLTAAGFRELAEAGAWPSEAGRYFLVRGGSFVAWNTEGDTDPASGFRIIGAHTDSPNLRIKAHPDVRRAGWHQLGVETYGGPLLNSWLDRDLGLSGRVSHRSSGAAAVRLVQIDEPILRVPQLAIHLDREVTTDGLRLNKQQHLSPVWGVGTGSSDFRAMLAGATGIDDDDVLSWDLMVHDLTGSRRIGRDRELIAAPRLDNLATAYAAIRALTSPAALAHARAPQVVVLFDHEEVGSVSERGALSTLLPAALERIVVSRGGSREDYLRSLAATVIASGDMAHATHPNYADRHGPQHHIAMNGGPVLKMNTNVRYATDSRGAAQFMLACEQAGVPLQQYFHRSDLPCGSTIGPFAASMTGAVTVDFGAPMLSMHSARELCGVRDQVHYVAALTAFLAPTA